MNRRTEKENYGAAMRRLASLAIMIVIAVLCLNLENWNLLESGTGRRPVQGLYIVSIIIV
jgi:hypothetical protein